MNRILGGLESMGLITEDTKRENKYVKYTRYFIVTEEGTALLKLIYDSDIIPAFIFEGP